MNIHVPYKMCTIQQVRNLLQNSANSLGRVKLPKTTSRLAASFDFQMVKIQIIPHTKVEFGTPKNTKMPKINFARAITDFSV